jgi:hypothetical protein
LTGTCLALLQGVDNKHHNPGANVPMQGPDEPKGDRGQGDKTWSPGESEQGISNRPADEENFEKDTDRDEERWQQRERDRKPNR